MANMSYCRMRNTANDLQDCINAIEEGEYIDGINREEKRSLNEILELAQHLVDNLQDEIEEMSITF
jgi:hypothetical protein